MSDIIVRYISGMHVEMHLVARRRTQQQALEASIDKWKAIVALVRGGFIVDDGGPTSCGLCRKYYAKDCRGCPVRLATGRVQCIGSPYRRWETAPEGKQTTAMAVRELRFLESLRAQRKKK